jgi:hypothetical protein
MMPAPVLVIVEPARIAKWVADLRSIGGGPAAINVWHMIITASAAAPSTSIAGIPFIFILFFLSSLFVCLLLIDWDR